MIVGLLHPGEMGAAVGNALAAAGNTVVWASEGRSEATRARAAAFEDVVTVTRLAERSAAIVSVVPPHAALAVAAAVGAFDGLYLDANAIAPSTAQRIDLPRVVDGGIVGGPPAPRLYLSGAEAETAAALFAGSPIETRIVADASALKCAYAAWTKGSNALLLAARAYAERAGVWEALAAEWADLGLSVAEDRVARKAWRWVGEMEEIARAFGDAGLPRGFHEAAAAVYESIGRPTVSGSRNDGASSP